MNEHGAVYHPPRFPVESSRRHGGLAVRPRWIDALVCESGPMTYNRQDGGGHDRKGGQAGDLELFA